jgi:hypothetical protein
MKEKKKVRIQFSNKSNENNKMLRCKNNFLSLFCSDAIDKTKTPIDFENI